MDNMNEYYIYFGIIAILCIYFANTIVNTIETAKNTAFDYLEQKIKGQFIHNGSLKTIYFPENSIYQKLLETCGFIHI
jgi:hypothetical protein